MWLPFYLSLKSSKTLTLNLRLNRRQLPTMGLKEALTPQYHQKLIKILFPLKPGYGSFNSSPSYSMEYKTNIGNTVRCCLKKIPK